jgi:eukaryotic-like serine/threonine-protein kinase
MTSDRRHQISALYQAALQRVPEERSAFLHEACGGDDRLREEVESLLRYDAASARFLEQPAAAVAAGGWRLLRLAGRRC